MGQDGDLSTSRSAWSSHHPQPGGAGGGLEGILAALGLSLCLSSKEEVLGLPVPPGTAFFSSYIQKRRSGRQVKRRKYNEDLDFKVVDDDGETIAVLGAGRTSALSASTLAWQAEVVLGVGLGGAGDLPHAGCPKMAVLRLEEVVGPSSSMG